MAVTEGLVVETTGGFKEGGKGGQTILHVFLDRMRMYGFLHPQCRMDIGINCQAASVREFYGLRPALRAACSLRRIVTTVPQEPDLTSIALRNSANT